MAKSKKKVKGVFDFSGPEGNVVNILAMLENKKAMPNEGHLRTMFYPGICLWFIQQFRDELDFVNIPDSVYEVSSHGSNTTN